jgi:hypothetical protein
MRIFITQSVPSIPLLSFVPGDHADRLFQNIPAEEYTHAFTIVTNETDADMVLMPHEYVHVKNNHAYLDSLRALYTKLIVIFAGGDATDSFADTRFVFLRTSAYKSLLASNEHIMPAIVEDLGAVHGAEPLSIQGKVQIGFVGYAGLPDYFAYVKYLVRNYIRRSGPRRQGLYFRRSAMDALKHDSRFQTAFIERKTFSANKKTISLDPAQARREYIDNIKQNHFTLCPRGDGNFSLRFYEVLSLGRIPILIDTDVTLPLEHSINYDEFIVRVPWNDVARVGDYVDAFIAKQGTGGVARMMQQARITFETRLYFPRFLEQLSSELRHDAH